jgi:hypothetical protein
MLDEQRERFLKTCLAALVIAAALAAPARADGDPLHGRWAVDPSDCASNRYVWVFGRDRAGLFIDNGAVSGWRRVIYRAVEEGVVAVQLEGAQRRELRWRFRNPDEIANAGVVENGRLVEERSFQIWRRCSG